VSAVVRCVALRCACEVALGPTSQVERRWGSFLPLCPTPRQELFWKRAGFPMGTAGPGYLAITTMSSTGTYPDFQVDLHGSCVSCLQR
jgi:hypothetical protein